ncbi:uncharacterized protein LOC110975594 [Acanthaster planci]|uniref:Uncharacterized protein LOC110975594 n=1 Tax=Acanthaster planci TaxID=133434 RepID=A0A8B7XUF6_ACAPL|nr:uncharacterized protein LOC110975594 [Acanthaster planci]
MSSDHESSDIEGSPTPRTSPAQPAWWSDSDGRRSARDVADVDESPWWESDGEVEKQQLCSDSPNILPSPCRRASSESSVTPTWWVEPSSRELSTSGAEVDGGREHCFLGPSTEAGSERERGGDKDGSLSESWKSRKRSREQSHQSSICQREPPLSKPKLEPPSPNAEPRSVLQDLKRGIFQPIQSFLLFFNVDLLTKICDLTNAEGWQRILQEPSLASEDGSWSEVTVKEMYALLAVVLMMRQHPDVCFGAFWREQPDQSGCWPRELMKRSRFFTLLQVLRLHVSEHMDDTSKVDVTYQRTAADSEIQQSQSSFIKDGLPPKGLKYIFDHIERIFQVFFNEFEFQCFEDVSLSDQSYQVKMQNYMRISPSSFDTPVDKTLDSQSKSEKVSHVEPITDLATCNRAISAQGSLTSNQVEESGKRENELGSSKVRSEERERDGKLSDLASSTSSKLPSIHSNGMSKITRMSNKIKVRWQQGNLLSVIITKDSTRASPITLNATTDKYGTEDGQSGSQSWKEVFVPCPELVYRDCALGLPCNTTDSVSGDRSGWEGLGKSFLYHYLHLAVYFASSREVTRMHLGSNKLLPDLDSLERIIKGLALLGKPDSILQSDSDSEASESDTSCYMMSTDHSDSDGLDDQDCKNKAGRPKPHKYVQARSRLGRKCALCWALYQESRQVHTRCTRCGWHLCLSQFRNCMQEAHQDKEIMKQLWDKDANDVQSTSDTSETVNS